MQMQKDVHQCFNGYTKAFDKLLYKELFQLLGKFDLFIKYVRIIQNLFWEQTACIPIANELSSFAKIEKDIRQPSIY